MKVLSTLAVALATSATFPAALNAAPIIDNKIAQFGLEPRFTCGKWVKPWKGAKWCVGTGRTEFLQHDFHLVLDGPPPDQAARQVLNEAWTAALGAALGVSIAPGPFLGASVGASLAAAKVAFFAYLATRGFERLIDSYNLRLDERTYWS